MKQGSENFGVFGTTSTLILPASQYRVAVLISGSNAGRITISTSNPAVLDRGILINNAVRPIWLNRDNVGDAITKAWFAVADAANRSIGWIEVFELDDPRD